jgi:hypothetical protein
MKVLNRMAVGLVGLAISSATLAEGYSDQVKRWLRNSKQTYLDRGWRESYNDVFDSLREGDSDSFRLTLTKGTSYRMISKCDKDCSDIDLILYDENDNKISEDTAADDDPVVDVRPK